MNPLLAEFVGTTLGVLLGNGVVANVILSKTKGNGGGLIVITVGWAMAVFVGVFTVASASGAHLNPAVTVALAVAGKFPWGSVPGYIAAQMLGGMMGAFLVWLVYRKHFEQTTDGDTKLAVFCTGPAIRNIFGNLISEVVGTFVLVYGVLSIASPKFGLGALDALPVALLVMSIGVSLGGTTGYAINPARDLGPRLMHALLPIPGKRDSDWGYAFVPVLGSITGGVLAALLYGLGSTMSH
ncbi:MIP/aquaporin family protein [Glaciimonas sp. PAMC28666]|uniref:MIP/aquaporin family protein n=1 Tax=Glaciimonas sp. PAMC28666 TaxID=2807626 RepID=UPI001962AAEF|nr:MIP/aquaporin family protein [Glaciimonas sp. PAMC28666]QRX80947.1 aquaporin family protein [Glaciimonas sp. PAMC28666]